MTLRNKALRKTTLVTALALSCGFSVLAYAHSGACLLYTSPSPRDVEESRMPSSA